MYALRGSIFEIFAENKKAVFRELSAHWFLANISKFEPRRVYIASQVQYKCDVCGHFKPKYSPLRPSYAEI